MEPGVVVPAIHSVKYKMSSLCLYSDVAEPVQLLGGDRSFPIIGQNEEFSVIETAWKLLTTDPLGPNVCQQQPMGVQKNCSFLLNCNLLKDRRDVHADDLGSWRHNGVITTYLMVNKDLQGKVVEINKKHRRFQPDEESRKMYYLMRRVNHKNGTAPDFKRMIVEIEGKFTII